jgi:hypothetical protein
MHNMAHRHRRAARKLGMAKPELKAYVILDSHHRPDLRGEFAGAKVKRINGKQIVHLSAKSARFYLDSGSIEPMVKEEERREVLAAASDE